MENVDRQKQKEIRWVTQERNFDQFPKSLFASHLIGWPINLQYSSKMWFVIKTKIEFLYFKFWLTILLVRDSWFEQIGELDEIGQSGFIALDGARLDDNKPRLFFEWVWTSLNKFIFIFLHFFCLNQKNLEWLSRWSVDFNIRIDFMNKKWCSQITQTTT